MGSLNSLSAWAGWITRHVLVLSYFEVATTLTNSITCVAAKVVVAFFTGENAAGTMVVLPGSYALPAKEGAIVPAAGVDGVHVTHQNLKMMIMMMVMMVSMVGQ